MGEKKRSVFIKQRGRRFFEKGGAAVLIVACFLAFATACQPDRALTLGTAPELLGQTGAEQGKDDAGEPENTLEERIFVHVCGAVKEPGLKELPEGSRVCDALERAGGFTEEADRDYVNLAARVTDGQKLYFPTSEETSRLNSNQENGVGKVNVNTADLEKLCTLPGIGESRAKAILKYRKEHGLFQSAEEILNVPGIKEGLYEQIRDLICVGL